MPLPPTSYLLPPRAKRSGFTLIEMLIVVGITSLLAGGILTYSSASRDRVALSVEEAKLAQTISRAKSLALTTYARESDNIPCGYGVSLDYEAHAYELFAYEVPLEEAGEGVRCGTITRLSDEGKSERESFRLPPSLVLQEGETLLEHVLFLPPDPSTWIWRRGEMATSTSGMIYIGSRSGTAPAKIEIGQGGQVSF